MCDVVHSGVLAPKEQKFDPRTSKGLSRGDSHLIFEDEVLQVRTMKRRPEERRWQAGRVQQLDALPWLLRPTRVRERVIQRRRRYITWTNIRKYGGTPGCEACTVDSTHRSKQCIERFQAIFEKEAAEAAAAAVAGAGADVHLAHEPAGERQYWRRSTSCFWAAAETTTAGARVRDKGSTRQTDSAPMDGTGSSSTLQPPPPTVAPEQDVEIATRRSRGMLLLNPEHVRIGRQAELNRLHRHRVVEDVSNGQEEVHVQGCAEAGL